MIEEINKRYKNNIIKPWGSNYIHSSKLKYYIIELINNWYEILWYDWIIINKRWTLWPMSLIFDFCRKDYTAEERNNLALNNIDELFNKAIKEGFLMDDLYVDIVIK